MDEIASAAGLTVEELNNMLRNEPPLPNLHEISFHDARILIDFYGPDFLFADSVVSDVRAYFVHRTRIEEFERKARRKSGGSSDDEEK